MPFTIQKKQGIRIDSSTSNATLVFDSTVPDMSDTGATPIDLCNRYRIYSLIAATSTCTHAWLGWMKQISNEYGHYALLLCTVCRTNAQLKKCMWWRHTANLQLLLLYSKRDVHVYGDGTMRTTYSSLRLPFSLLHSLLLIRNWMQYTGFSS